MNTCAYCGGNIYKCEGYYNTSKERTIDHIIPHSRGGIDLPNNKIFCCRACNGWKDNLLLVEWEVVVRQSNHPRKCIILKNIQILLLKSTI